MGCAQTSPPTPVQKDHNLSEQNETILNLLTDQARKDVVFVDADNNVLSKQYTAIDWKEENSVGLPSDILRNTDGSISPLWNSNDNACSVGIDTGLFFRERFLSTVNTPINWMQATLYLPTGAINEGVNNIDTTAQSGGYLYTKPGDDPRLDVRTDGPFFYIGMWSSNTNADGYSIDAGFQLSTGHYGANPPNQYNYLPSDGVWTFFIRNSYMNVISTSSHDSRQVNGAKYKGGSEVVISMAIIDDRLIVSTSYKDGSNPSTIVMDFSNDKYKAKSGFNGSGIDMMFKVMAGIGQAQAGNADKRDVKGSGFVNNMQVKDLKLGFFDQKSLIPSTPESPNNSETYSQNVLKSLKLQKTYTRKSLKVLRCVADDTHKELPKAENYTGKYLNIVYLNGYPSVSVNLKNVYPKISLQANFSPIYIEIPILSKKDVNLTIKNATQLKLLAKIKLYPNWLIFSAPLYDGGGFYYTKDMIQSTLSFTSKATIQCPEQPQTLTAQINVFDPRNPKAISSPKLTVKCIDPLKISKPQDMSAVARRLFPGGGLKLPTGPENTNQQILAFQNLSDVPLTIKSASAQLSSGTLSFSNTFPVVLGAKQSQDLTLKLECDDPITEMVNIRIRSTPENGTERETVVPVKVSCLTSILGAEKERRMYAYIRSQSTTEFGAVFNTSSIDARFKIQNNAVAAARMSVQGGGIGQLSFTNSSDTIPAKGTYASVMPSQITLTCDDRFGIESEMVTIYTDNPLQREFNVNIKKYCLYAVNIYTGFIRPNHDEANTYQWVVLDPNKIANRNSGWSADNYRAMNYVSPDVHLFGDAATLDEAKEKVRSEVKRIYGVELAGSDENGMNIGYKNNFLEEGVDSQYTVGASAYILNAKNILPPKGSICMEWYWMDLGYQKGVGSWCPQTQP